MRDNCATQWGREASRTVRKVACSAQRATVESSKVDKKTWVLTSALTMSKLGLRLGLLMPCHVKNKVRSPHAF